MPVCKLVSVDYLNRNITMPVCKLVSVDFLNRTGKQGAD